MEMRNPQYISYLLIATALIVVIPVLKKRYHSGNRKIANTKYAKKTKMYKILMARIIIFTILIVAAFSACMIASSYLLAQVVEVKEEKNEKFNRDIFLCMDVSGSMFRLNSQIAKTFKSTVKKLDGDRVGIMIFDSSSVILSPLTDDYDYILKILDNLEKAMGGYLNGDYSNIRYVTAGAQYGAGSSLIGDGLASCVDKFVKTDLSNEEMMNEKRTRIILLSTDNFLAGNSLFTIGEAAKLAKNHGIKVYGLYPIKITDFNHYATEMETAVKSTGGKLYDASDSSTVSTIINRITSTEKSILKSETQVVRTDIPQVYFKTLLVAFIAYVILGKLVRK